MDKYQNIVFGFWIYTSFISPLQINQKLWSVTVFTILICSRKKWFQAFIYIYYNSFDIHRCSSPTGSFYPFCINLLKQKDPKVINKRLWYIYS